MEIRLAHPNEIEAIVNVLEEARAFLASSGIHQFQYIRLYEDPLLDRGHQPCDDLRGDRRVSQDG